MSVGGEGAGPRLRRLVGVLKESRAQVSAERRLRRGPCAPPFMRLDR